MTKKNNFSREINENNNNNNNNKKKQLKSRAL